MSSDRTTLPGRFLFRIWRLALPLLHLTCPFPHRSGSVCLDVINQTWSPMYGQSLVLQSS